MAAGPFSMPPVGQAYGVSPHPLGSYPSVGVAAAPMYTSGGSYTPPVSHMVTYSSGGAGPLNSNGYEYAVGIAQARAAACVSSRLTAHSPADGLTGHHPGRDGEDGGAFHRDRLTYHGEKAWVGKLQLVPQPTPSPLQQWIRDRPPQELPEYTPGHPVRLVHMTAPSLLSLNKLVGDIIHTHKAPDGSLIFAVRVPLFPSIMHNAKLNHKPDHFKIHMSHWSRQAAPENRKRVAHLYGLTGFEAEDMDEFDPSGRLPPFILVENIPSEKIDPIAVTQAGNEGRGHAWVRPPVWGPPLTNEELAFYSKNGVLSHAKANASGLVVGAHGQRPAEEKSEVKAAGEEKEEGGFLSYFRSY